MDPYEILEVSRNATDDEIKKAYRELAKKYHPDNFKDNPLSDLATEKMKRINAAYDEIQKERSNAGKNGASAGFNFSGAGATGSAPGDFNTIRILIGNGRFSEAERVLESVPAERRGAEWQYLKGVILMRRGWFFDAVRYLENACAMEPSNGEYRSALAAARSHGTTPYNTRTSGGEICGGSDLCTTLLCMNCLCDCMRCMR